MRVIIVGDFCDCGRITRLISEGKNDILFAEVRQLIVAADVGIVNIEFPIVRDSNKANPIQKCGPNLKGQRAAIEAIKYAGFTVCTLANNHILDQGEYCCLDTKRVIEEESLKTAGVGKCLSEAGETLYCDTRKGVLAIINCCEHEYSIATETTPGANPLNPVRQFYKIQEARKEADYVLVIVHGGHEHYQLPSPRMQEIYRFFIDAGADAVINHHQHCYSGYEEYKGKPIFYGLGNFCFDKLYDGLPNSWHEGYMVELDFKFGGKTLYKLIPYIQCKETPSVVLMKDDEHHLFLKEINELNKIIANPDLLKKKHEEWMEKNSGGFEHQFLPYRNHWLISAYIRHLFPSFVSKKKLLILQNHFECESHRERSLFALNKLIRNKDL